MRQSVYDAMGVKFDEGEEMPPIRTALDRYFAVDAAQYMDASTREVDWAAFYDAREQALASLSPEQRKAADAEITKNLTPFARQFRDASAVYSELRNKVPKHQGLSASQGQTIDRFIANAQDQAGRTGQPFNYVATQLGQRNGQQKLADWAIYVQRAGTGITNPAYDRFIYRYRSKLEVFYPDLYTAARARRSGEPIDTELVGVE